ncbi:hypothetical protein SCHPADRAFT_935459 [Schizopora paradoxa]|uniref:Uncharacterized protein n=1 Tax=Schizopora paradoxa TaxID=27342 RepID=A0A0H2SCG4_9AGAM|nr:hypothetical protein SCHPADRAFT_935459 [Schizopora paradoxa]
MNSHYPKTRNFVSNGSPGPLPRFSSSESESPFRAPRKISTLLWLLAGAGAATYVLYNSYKTSSSRTKWPSEVRSDVRSGLRAKDRKDWKRSQMYLHRAWETIKTLSDEVHAPKPYMKTSDVAIALAQVLEADNKPLEAYGLYTEALQLARPLLKEDSARAFDVSLEGLKAQTSALSLGERERTVAIALKLGEMAEQYGIPAEEKWLKYALSEVMRISRMDDTKDNTMKLLLPSWLSLSKSEIALPIEMLASFYRRQGNLENVMKTYAIAGTMLLMRLQFRRESIEDLCWYVMVCNNAAETAVELSRENIENKTTILEMGAKMASQATINCHQLLHLGKSSTVLREASLCGRAFLLAAYNLSVINSLLDKENCQGEDERRLVEAHGFLEQNFKDELNDPDVQKALKSWRGQRRRLDRNQPVTES